jgi:NAD(P)-dependent dehydrogenase (short-subunit alcohol dehydrogenase family)
MCHQCLGEQLRWRKMDGAGELLSVTNVHVSQDLYFRARTPWRLGMVRLDCGPTVILHLHAACPQPPSRVRVEARLDKSGQGVLIAFPLNEAPTMADDRQLREFTCDPKFRKALVTDGKTAVGQATVRALIAAGADLVWVGQAEPSMRSPGLEALSTLPKVAVVPLDITDAESVTQLAGEIGGRVDILINNAELHRSQGACSGTGLEFARAEMDVNYFGLLRLAQAFGPVLKTRGADGQSSAVAWVNVLSVFALSNFPLHGTFSASKAAALSLAQCLRAELQPAGLRVVNVFPGPIDNEWNQTLPPPKLGADALARAIVTALRDGVEDVYPGDVAQEWLERWRESPKVLERELA